MRSAAPSGVLEHPGTIKDPLRVKESWNSAYQGSANAHKIAVLEEGMKYEPVKVYELVSRKGQEPPDWTEHFAAYDAGLQAYGARQWEQAEERFELLLTRWPEDGAAKAYLQRCREFRQHPPPQDWDGVYRLTHK